MDTMILDSGSVLVENAFKANSQKPLDEKALEEIGIVNQGLRSKLVRPTFSSTRQRSERPGDPIATNPSRSSRRRSIFDIEEDGTDSVPVNDTVQMASSPRLSPFTPINQKRKHISTLEEVGESVVAEETPFRKGPLDGLPVSKKRKKNSFVGAAQLGPLDGTDITSRYWSSSRNPAGLSEKMRRGPSAKRQIQQSSEQDSSIITPPPGFPSSYRIQTPKATDSENNSNLQEIPFNTGSPDRPRMRKGRRVSSFVDAEELELHERAGEKTRAFRTAKTYGQDVAEMRDDLVRKRQKEMASGDLTDSIRTAC